MYFVALAVTVLQGYVYEGMRFELENITLTGPTLRTVLSYKTGFAVFFCLQEPIFDVLVIFALKLEVYVCLVKSSLILIFLFIKTVIGELNNSKFGGKTSVTL